MSEDTHGEVAATTSRAVFDNAPIDNEDIPLFLRKQYGDDVMPKKTTTLTKNAPARGQLDEAVRPVEAPAETKGETVSVQQTDEPVIETDPPKLDDMTVDELQQLETEIQQKKEARRLAEKIAVIEQIVHVVETYKIPIDELVEALGGLKIKRKGVKAIQKYRDPSTGATWSGRGKEPSWIKGKDRKKFAIT